MLFRSRKSKPTTPRTSKPTTPRVSKPPSARGSKSGTPRSSRKKSPAKSPAASARGNKADRDPDLKDDGRFDSVEKDVFHLIDTLDELKAFWGALDVNGNGLVSLAEIDKAVVERFPVLNHKPALIRAYKRTTSKEGGGDGDDWVEKKEVKNLLRNLLFYNKLFNAFEEVDTGDDRRIDLAEFQAGLPKLGMQLAEAESQAEFESIDTNGGGQVLFDEFCEWFLQKKQVWNYFALVV